MVRSIGPALFLTLALPLAGCSDSAPYGEVEGEVALDGKPLAEGVVRFTPVNGNAGTASALIENGRFAEKKVPVALHRVEISSPVLPKGVKSQKEMKRGTVDEGAALEELIPRRYNSDSTLTADIKSGKNSLKFELTSKP
jgi:hypothetical protein